LLSLVIFLSLPLFPWAGAFLAVMAPLPLLQLAASGRSSYQAWGWVAAVLAGCAFLVTGSWPAALLGGYLLITVWPTVSVEQWQRRTWSAGRWLVIVTLVALAGSLAMTVAESYPGDPVTALATEVEALRSQAVKLADGDGRVVDALDSVAPAMNAVAYAAPGIQALYVMLVALWLRPRLRLIGLARGEAPFATFASEEWLPLGFVLGGLGWVFLPEPGKWLATNLFVTVIGLYFIHGLAIIHFHLGPVVTASRWLRLGVGLLVLPIAPLVSALGLADNFVRLRRGDGSNEGSTL
jgi:hypothetical protein